MSLATFLGVPVINVSFSIDCDPSNALSLLFLEQEFLFASTKFQTNNSPFDSCFKYSLSSEPSVTTSGIC